jgi:hypothetical protein
MRKESRNDLHRINPEEEATIAIKALQEGDVEKIASEYGICPASVRRLRAILEENAIDLFIPDIVGKSICRSLGEIRCQIQIMDGVITELLEILRIRNGDYFLE